MVFYLRHLCRLDPWPEAVTVAMGRIDEDPTVYHTMNGPSEFHVIGTIRDWSSRSRLGGIAVPTFVVSGEYDEATPALQVPLVDGIGANGVEVRAGGARRLLAPAVLGGPRALHRPGRRLAARHD